MTKLAALLSVCVSVSAFAFGGCAANGADAVPEEDPNQQPADETQADAFAAESVVGTVANGTHLKTTAALNLRTSGSTSASVILVIPAGATVTAVSGTPKSGWYNVSYSGHVGWSYGAYLDKVSSSSPPPSSGGSLACSHVQWWNSYITSDKWSNGWDDTDLGISHGTPVQLRHASRLERHGVYAWGWMPEFTDLVTGKRFRFLHLLPTDRYTTSIGTTYPAGTIVGLSGGDTKATGYGVYSTGAHLCVQTLSGFRAVFPAGHDACH